MSKQQRELREVTKKKKFIQKGKLYATNPTIRDFDKFVCTLYLLFGVVIVFKKISISIHVSMKSYFDDKRFVS